MVLRRSDGKEVVAKWKHQRISLDMPQLLIEGKSLRIVKPLKWYEWAWSGLPLLLILVGGALGGVAGGIGFVTNAKIFRTDKSGPTKFALAGGVSLLVFSVYFGLVIVIGYVLSR